MLGKEHVDTLRSKRFLQKLLLASMEETVLSRLSNFFIKGKEGAVQYTDFEIGKVSLLLNQLNPKWGKVPQTYIILRIINCLDLLDKSIDLGFSDHLLLVTER